MLVLDTNVAPALMAAQKELQRSQLEVSPLAMRHPTVVPCSLNGCSLSGSAGE